MTEPENHTLHLLREIREDIRKFEHDIREDVQKLDRKVDMIHDDLGKRIDGLVRTLAGEMADRSHAAGGVERRLADIEKRLAALEQDR